MPREILRDAREKHAVREELEDVIRNLRSAHEVLSALVEQMEDEDQEDD